MYLTICYLVNKCDNERKSMEIIYLEVLGEVHFSHLNTSQFKSNSKSKSLMG